MDAGNGIVERVLLRFGYVEISKWFAWCCWLKTEPGPMRRPAAEFPRTDILSVRSCYLANH